MKATAYLEITMKIDPANRPATAKVYTDYREPFLNTIAGAVSKALLVRQEDVQVLQEAKEGAEWLLNDDPGLQKPENRGILDHVRVQFEDNENRLN